jgi:hypothetical protein
MTQRCLSNKLVAFVCRSLGLLQVKSPRAPMAPRRLVLMIEAIPDLAMVNEGHAGFVYYLQENWPTQRCCLP